MSSSGDDHLKPVSWKALYLEASAVSKTTRNWWISSRFKIWLPKQSITFSPTRLLKIKKSSWRRTSATSSSKKSSWFHSTPRHLDSRQKPLIRSACSPAKTPSLESTSESRQTFLLDQDPTSPSTKLSKDRRIGRWEVTSKLIMKASGRAAIESKLDIWPKWSKRIRSQEWQASTTMKTNIQRRPSIIIYHQ